MASKPTHLDHYQSSASPYQDAGHHYDDYSTSDSDSDYDDYDERRVAYVEYPMGQSAQPAEARGRRGRQPRDEHGRYKSRGVATAEAPAAAQAPAPAAAALDPADAHYSMKKHKKYSKSHRGPSHFHAYGGAGAYPVNDAFDDYYEDRSGRYYGQPDTRQRYAGRYPVEPRAAAGAAGKAVEGASARSGAVFSIPAPPPAAARVEEVPLLQLDFQQENPLLEFEAVGCVGFYGTPEQFANGEALTAVVGAKNPIKTLGLEKLMLLGERPTPQHLQHVIVTRIECLGKSVPDNFPYPYATLDLKNTNLRDSNRKIVGKYSAEEDSEPHLLVAHAGEKSDYPDVLYDWTKIGQDKSVDPRALSEWLYVTNERFFEGHRYFPKPGTDEIDANTIYLPLWNRVVRLLDRNPGRYGKMDGMTYSQYKIKTRQARYMDNTEVYIPVSIEDLMDLIRSLEDDVHNKAPTVNVENGLEFQLGIPGGCPMVEAHAAYREHEEEHRRFHAGKKKMCKLFFTIKICGIVPASDKAMERARARMPSAAQPAQASA